MLWEIRKKGISYMRFDVLVGLVGIAVTLVSILTTGISIWQDHRNRENQKSNRPTPKD